MFRFSKSMYSVRKRLGRSTFRPQIETLETRELMSVSPLLESTAVITAPTRTTDPVVAQTSSVGGTLPTGDSGGTSTANAFVSDEILDHLLDNFSGLQLQMAPTAAGLARINSLPDSRVRTAALAAYEPDGSISRDDMIDVFFAGSVGYTDLTTDAARSFDLLVGSADVFMPRHVRNLAGKVLAQTPVDELSPAQTLKRSVDDFFLGLNRPASDVAGYSYMQVNKPLWDGDPRFSDIARVRSAGGFSWFLTSLEEVVWRNSYDIKRMFIDNGDQTFTIGFDLGTAVDPFTGSFYDKRDYVTVDNYLLHLPGFSDDYYYGAGSSALWVHLLMKAYIQQSAGGTLNSSTGQMQAGFESLKPGVNSYEALYRRRVPETGNYQFVNPAWVFAAISEGGNQYGNNLHAVDDYDHNEAVRNAWKLGYYVALKTHVTGTHELLGNDRWYALVNYVPGKYTVTQDGKHFLELVSEILAVNFESFVYVQGVPLSTAFALTSPAQVDAPILAVSGPAFGLQKNIGQFTDQDGDTYTVRLSGPGRLHVQIDDPDGDGRGPIAQIVVQNSDARSSLAVTVRKAAGGDGVVSIGLIDAPALRNISAPASDLLDGIYLGGLLAGLTIRNISSDAEIRAGGGSAAATSLTANVIGDKATIHLGSTISTLKAASVGDADIAAPAIGAMLIRGDFDADLSLAGTGNPRKPISLGSASIGGGIDAAAWNIFGNVGAIAVKGAVTNWDLAINGSLTRGTFGDVDHAALKVTKSVRSLAMKTFLDSDLFAGFTPAAESRALPGAFTTGVALGSFTVSGIAGSQHAAFANSNVAAAAIGIVSLHSVQTNNDGASFGILADLSIRAVTVKNPLFVYNARLAGLQGLEDFQVQVI